MRRALELSLLLALLPGLAALAPGTAGAGEVEVVAASAEREPGGTWRFEVTLRHADEGWEHYADAWEVLGPDGTVLGRRELLHPHVEEQPFTRSLAGVAVPEPVSRVLVRGHDSRHGHGGSTLDVELSR